CAHVDRVSQRAAVASARRSAAVSIVQARAERDRGHAERRRHLFRAAGVSPRRPTGGGVVYGTAAARLTSVRAVAYSADARPSSFLRHRCTFYVLLRDYYADSVRCQAASYAPAQPVYARVAP